MKALVQCRLQAGSQLLAVPMKIDLHDFCKIFSLLNWRGRRCNGLGTKAVTEVEPWSGVHAREFDTLFLASVVRPPSAFVFG
jgi:hypothetical protein